MAKNKNNEGIKKKADEEKKMKECKQRSYRKNN